MKPRRILNEMGIYTNKQYLELKKRNRELWNALNSAHSCMLVRGNSIKGAVMSDQDDGFKNSIIVNSADVLIEKATQVYYVMFDKKSNADFS